MADTSYTLAGSELSQVMAGLSQRALSILASRDMIANPFDYRKPLSTIALYLASQARQCFDQSRSPEGGAWEPLKNPSQRRGGASAKPLRDTDKLMASLVGQAVGHVADIAGASLTYGSNLPYASFHQEGTGTIPARPFLGITDAMKARIRLIVIDWLEREAKASP